MANLKNMTEICEYYRRSPATVLSLIRNYGFPAAKNPGQWESTTEDIDEWIKNRIKSEKPRRNRSVKNW